VLSGVGRLDVKTEEKAREGVSDCIWSEDEDKGSSAGSGAGDVELKATGLSLRLSTDVAPAAFCAQFEHRTIAAGCESEPEEAANHEIEVPIDCAVAVT
jgi:hypothetical protein